MSDIDVQERGSMAAADQGIIIEGLKKSNIDDIHKMSVFNFADRNKDGIINKAEVERYNSPLFMKNYDTGREVMLEAKRENPFASKGYVDFFAGLKFEDVNEQAKKDFKLMDLNNDGVLSVSEMNAMEKAFNATQKAIKNAFNIGDKGGLFSTAPMIAAASAFPISLILWFSKSLFEEASFLKWMGVSSGIVLLGCAITAGIYAWCNYKADKNSKKLAEETENHPYSLSKLQEVQNTYKDIRIY